MPPNQPGRAERRSRVISETERDEIAAAIAAAAASQVAAAIVAAFNNRRQEIAKYLGHQFVDIFYARTAAAAKQEEQDRLADIGRNVEDFWKRYRFRILGGIGFVGIEVLTRVPIKWSAVAEKIMSWMMEP